MESQLSSGSEKLSQNLNRRPHITDLPISWNDWYLHLNWLYIVQLVVIPAVGLTQAWWTPLLWRTAVWAVFYYFVTGIGITAGYHRLWAHRSYSASTSLAIYLAGAGAGAVEGSIRHWSREHRAHHRFTDTDKDPYSVKKGILYAHMGWLVMKQHPDRMGRVDIADLNHNAIVMLQHRYYIPIALFTGYVIPTLVACFWGDPFGGFIYAGVIRIFTVNQATFAVNSLAHWLGDQPFDDRISPRDHIVTALATMGEGYHNFHHEFPSDYRNAIKWHQYDPTKWCIWTWKQMGLAYNLQEFPTNEIEKGQVQQIRKKLDQRSAKLDWGLPVDQLPVLSWDEFRENVKEGGQLIAISGVIHDVSGFINDHPGGQAMLSSGIGKDATAVFNGGIYNHTNAAHNLLASMRVAALRGGVEVEAWKESYNHNLEPPFSRTS